MSVPQHTLPCKDTVIIPQFSGTCWANALLMCVFYSEAMRDVVIAYRKKWGTTMPDNQYTKDLVKIFDDMVRLYKRPGGDDKDFYEVNSPEKILYFLRRANPSIFEYDAVRQNSKGKYVIREGWRTGYFPRMYTRKLLFFLGIPSVTLDAVKMTDGGLRLSLGNTHSRTQVTKGKNNRGVYSYRAKSREEVLKIVRSSPPVLVVDIGYSDDWKEKTGKSKPDYYYFGGRHQTIPQEIKFGSHRYILDTVTLSNTNNGNKVRTNSGIKTVGGHAISGVTCNGRRYIYSGWITKTKNAAKVNDANSANGRDGNSPCPLMPFDWAVDRRSFYITSKICQVQFKPPKPNSMRFNSVVGKRAHYYVRSDLVKYKTKMLQRLGAVSGREKLLLGKNIIRRTISNATRKSVRLNQKQAPPRKKKTKKLRRRS